MTTEPFNNDVNYGQVYYKRNLGNDGTTMYMDIDYTQTDPGFLLEDLDLKGQSAHFLGQISHPFIRSRKQNLYMNVSLEYLNSKTTSYMDVKPFQLFKDEISSLRLEGVYDIIDSWRGIDTFSTEISQGLPGLGSSIDDATSRPGGHSDYTKLNVYAARLQALPKSFSALFAVYRVYSCRSLFE